jgi:hypothetical protein
MNRASVKPNAISRSTRKVFPEGGFIPTTIATSIGMGIEVTATAPRDESVLERTIVFHLYCSHVGFPRHVDIILLTKYSPTKSKHEGEYPIASNHIYKCLYSDGMKGFERNHTRYSVVLAGRFQTMSLSTACHEGLEEISFHHLQWTRQKSQISKFGHIPCLWR